MGRSVSYLNNAEFVLYFPTPEGLDENGEYNDDIAQFNWEDMISNLQYEIKGRLKSYYISENKWDNRETKIILENSFCVIGISEYYGLCSLSVAVKDSNDIDGYLTYRENFGKYHAQKIELTLKKVLNDLGLKEYKKIGTFSNGEGVYELTNKKG